MSTNKKQQKTKVQDILQGSHTKHELNSKQMTSEPSKDDINTLLLA